MVSAALVWSFYKFYYTMIQKKKEVGDKFDMKIIAHNSALVNA